MITPEDVRNLVVEKNPRLKAKKAFEVLVDKSVEMAGKLIWRHHSWSFSKATQAPPDDSYISFTATGQYSLKNDFYRPLFVWCKELGREPEVKIESPENFRRKYPDYTLILGYPSVCYFEKKRKIHLFGDQSSSVGVIYQFKGGTSELLSHDESFMVVLIPMVEYLIAPEGSKSALMAMQEAYKMLKDKMKTDIPFEPTIEVQPHPFHRAIQAAKDSLT